jgi:hypothetical protein
MNLEGQWRSKTDEELAAAARQLSDNTGALSAYARHDRPHRSERAPGCCQLAIVRCTFLMSVPPLHVITTRSVYVPLACVRVSYGLQVTLLSPFKQYGEKCSGLENTVSPAALISAKLISEGVVPDGAAST